MFLFKALDMSIKIIKIKKSSSQLIVITSGHQYLTQLLTAELRRWLANLYGYIAS